MAVFSGWTPLTDGGWLHATFILKSNRVDTTNAKLPFGIFKSDHCYFICGPDRLRPGKWDCGKWSVSEIGARLENGKYPTLSLFFIQTAIY